MKSSYSEKPLPHSTVGQWRSNNKNLEKVTVMRCYVGNEVRQKGCQIRNATENTTLWKLKETNEKMKERITEVDRWYNNLESSLEDLKDQIQRLSEAKVALEGSLEDLLPLQEATKEVLLVRDRRRDIDLVEDEPYYEIKKELKLIDKARNEFRQLAHDSWVQLLDMKEQRDKLAKDLQHKDNAMEIDKYKLSLTPESSGDISFKPRPMDLPENTVDFDTWYRNCLLRKKEAEASAVKSMQLANKAWGILKRTLDDVRKQRESTQKALRKRHHEILQARDKLGAQRKELMDEVEKVEKEMKDIESTIAEKMMGNMKLAETRLENRKWRRGNELCRDMTHDSIMEELDHVRKSKQTLEQQLADVKNNLNCLRYQLRQVEDDLQRKEHSLAIESVCLEAHTRPPKVPYQTDLAWRAPTTCLEFAAVSSPAEDDSGIQQDNGQEDLEHADMRAYSEDKATMTDQTEEECEM